MRTRLGLALTLLGLLAGALPLSASAADYTVVGVCKDPVAGLTFTSIIGTEGIAGQEGCFSAPENGALTIAAKGLTMTGGVTWTMSAPAGLTFHTLEAQRRFVTKPWDTHFRWEILAGGTAVETISGPTLPADGAVVTTIDAQSVSGKLTCLGTSCPGLAPNATIAGVELKSINARIIDQTPPTVAIGAVAEPLKGMVDVPFSASDVGGGVAGARLIVDGIAQEPVSDDNGGDCVEPFQLLVPCRLTLDSALPLDTTVWQDGPHEIRIEAFDLTGQATVTPPSTIRVHNGPTNTERPTLAGPATVGGELTTTTGKWDGDPIAFAYRWLRCPATATAGDPTGCAPIAAATAAQHTVTALDVGKRLVAEVTATNQLGSESVLSVPSEPVPGPTGGGGGPTGGGGGPNGGNRDTTPPVLSGVSLSRTRFRVGGKSTLKFSSSEAGKLSLAIAPARKGGPHGTMTRAIAAGKGRLVFRGRIGAKALRPGRYKLTVTARDATGNGSKPISLSFTILPG